MKKILFVISILCGLAIVYLSWFIIKPKNIIHMSNDYCIVDDLQYYINKQSLNDGIYYVEGWIIYPGKRQGYAVTDNKSIWLQNTVTKEMYKLKAMQSSKRDYSISKYFNDGTDYQSAIFESSVNLKELDIYNNDYDVYICYQYQGVNYLIKTNSRIVNGMLEN